MQEKEKHHFFLQKAGSFSDVYKRQVRKLLDKVRIGMIPLLNPDSYEICEYGYGAIHNPIHRQMLKMQDRPVEAVSYTHLYDAYEKKQKPERPARRRNGVNER